MEMETNWFPFSDNLNYGSKGAFLCKQVLVLDLVKKEVSELLFPETQCFSVRDEIISNNITLSVIFISPAFLL